MSPLIFCDAKNKGYVSISGVISSTGKLYYEVREQEGFKQRIRSCVKLGEKADLYRKAPDAKISDTRLDG